MSSVNEAKDQEMAGPAEVFPDKIGDAEEIT